MAFSHIHSVRVSIENILDARTQNDLELASIEKNFVGLTVTTLPLPQAVWLFSAAMMGLLSLSKGKKFI